MTKVLFIQDILFEFIGPMQISAVLKKEGHTCDLLIVSEEKNLIKKIKEINPDIVAFSVMTGSHRTLIDIANKIKKELNVLTVFGGPHATFYSNLIEEKGVDVICIGEGEYAMLELCNNFKKDITKIKNLWIKQNGKIIKNDIRPLIENLDDLPFLDRNLYYKRYKYLKILPTKKIMTGRGCPYNCNFCFNHKLKEMYKGKGKYIRKRSVNNVISEILELKKQGDIKAIRFSDDTFTLHHDWLIEFLKEYKNKINLPFTCLCRVNEVDEEIVKKLKESRCVNVFIGLESGNEKIRNDILKKNISTKDIIRVGKLLHKYKIKFGTYNMFGNPTETIEDAIGTIKLNSKIKTDFPFSTILQPYPGTEIAEYAIQEGILPEDYNINNIGFMTDKSEMKLEKKKEITNIHRFFYFGVKFPFLIPLIRILIKFPDNKLYYFIYKVGFAITRKNSFTLSFFDFIKIGWKLRKKL